MIVVAGYIDVAPEAAERLHEAAKVMMAETRKEAGCRVYDMTADLEVPGRLHIYEEWESLGHLGAHAKAPHMGDWRKKLGEMGVLTRNVRRYEGGEPTPL